MIQSKIAELVRDAIRKAQEGNELPEFEVPDIPIERPKLEGHGDFATPACLQMAKLARMAPVRIAGVINGHMSQADFVGHSEAVSPGYINFRLADLWLAQQVGVILEAGDRFGNVDLGHNSRIQVEYVSANPTGPLHVGSARNAVIGDALANVLAAAGYDVQREYYVNDGGTQMGLFAESLYARYAQALGHDVPLPESGYHGTYLAEMGGRAAREYGSCLLNMDHSEALKAIGDIGLSYTMETIKNDMAAMGITFDQWFSERSLYQGGGFEQVLNLLRSGGFLAERDGAVWFTATNLGADKDEVVIRSGGAPGYFASDIAYHYDKFVERGFERVIDVWGADHQGHVPRMKAMMRAMGLDPERLSIVLYQLVTLKRGGEIVRLSKRTGEIITLREVVEDVGADAVRFFLLSRSAESQMDFDLDLAKEQSSENPVYYVQYAHARICSILRLGADRGLDTVEGDLSLLTHPMELNLIRHMLMLPEIVELAASTLAPHHLSSYAQELASRFHVFYRDCRVVSSDPADRELSLARLRLMRAARLVLARTLHLMGMNAPEQM